MHPNSSFPSLPQQPPKSAARRYRLGLPPIAISFLAIINDSVPHILAVLMTRTISAIWRGPYFKADYHGLLADPSTPYALALFTEY